MHTPRTIVSTVTVLATVVSVFSPLTALPVYADIAATVPFSDAFPIDGADVLNWDTEEFSRISSGSVRIGCDVGGPIPGDPNTCDDGYGSISRTINATGYENLTLGYDWRANAGADASDFGLVQYCVGEECTDFADLVPDGHPLNDTSWGGNSVSLPPSVDDSMFRIRFTITSNLESERFWVDNVEVTGQEIPPSVPGCMDSEATNYNPDATEDDGSCEYPLDPPPCDPGYHLEGEECVPDEVEPPVCDEGYEWNGEECTLVQVPPTPEPENNSGGGGSGNPHPKATLIVKKVIVFGEDASISFSDFSFTVDGKKTYAFEEDGSNELKLRSGAHTITEEPGPGYTTGYSGDCDSNGNLRMIGDETYVCTVTNTLGVGGFNPGSEIPAPTPTPMPTPTPTGGNGGGSGSTGGSTGGSTLNGDAGETPTPTSEPGPASGFDETIASDSLTAAIGGGFLGIDFPWWILLLLLLVLWWWFRRSRST